MTIKEYKGLKNGDKLEITLPNGKSYSGKVETICVGGVRSPERRYKNMRIDDYDSMIVCESNFRGFKKVAK